MRRKKMIFDVKRIGKRTALMLAVMILSFNLSACGRTGEVQPDAADKSEEAAEMTAEGGTAEADSGSDDNITAAEEDTAQNAAQNSEQSADQSVDELLANMTLRDKVEQMMIVSYRIWKEVPDKADEALSQTVDNTEDEIPLFNKEAFVQSHKDKNSQLFLGEMVKTQIFNQFLLNEKQYNM